VGKVGKLAQLRARLAEAEETLRAIRAGEVDAVMVSGKSGSRVFTLRGAEHEYRILIESMNEGALTLTADKLILYANQAFARMVRCPLEQVTGSSFRRFLSDQDRATLRPLMKHPAKSGSKIQALLKACDGSQLPVQLSIRSLVHSDVHSAAIGMVVTDLTAVRRNEQLLRALTNRVVQVQETERGRVALELHDRITQLLCAALVRSQALANQLPAGGDLKREVIKLRGMLGRTAAEVERISHNLRPSVLNELGLVAVLRDTSLEFSEQTGVAVKLACDRLNGRLPPGVELALYRILQEALRNVQQHAHAQRVVVQLKAHTAGVALAISDDGIGFDPEQPGRVPDGLGLLSMRERAAYEGGALKIRSAHRAGTEIEVRIPVPRLNKKGGP
jgi:PAS domain S-box-containing protein